MEDSCLYYLSSTHTACTKYLVYHFNEAFDNYVVKYLIEENCCKFYHQLLRIEGVSDLLELVKTFIAINAERVLESGHFVWIDQDTLTSLLRIKWLNAPEPAILKACFKWVDHRLGLRGATATTENRRTLFGSIKSYLRLNQLTAEDCLKAGDLAAFLTKDELGDLFLCLFKDKSNPFHCLTDRTSIRLLRVALEDLTEEVPLTSPKFSLTMTVSRPALLKTIHTSVQSSPSMSAIRLFEDGKRLDIWFRSFFNCTGRLTCSFDLCQFFKVQPGRIYKLNIDFSTDKTDMQFTKSGQPKQLTVGSFKFDFGNCEVLPIKCIEFYASESEASLDSAS